MQNQRSDEALPALPHSLGEDTMITKLHLGDFKNFQDATLHLGPLTVLLGANASGKSNVRDALRFLHRVARGYTLADTIGEKWGEGGVLQWRGLRGGAVEAVRHGASTFTLIADVEIMSDQLGLIQPRRSDRKRRDNGRAAGNHPHFQQMHIFR